MEKSKIKTLVMVIALVLVVVLTAGLIAQRVTINKLKKAKEQLQVHTENTVTPDIGGMIIADGNIANNGVKLTKTKIAALNYAAYGISPQADSAYQLTATVSPSTAALSGVDWAVSWVDENSEWASGKTVTDYVTVTPQADGALTANVICLKAFADQIKIICISRSNDTAKCECTVDYSKRFLGFELTSNSVTKFIVGNENAYTFTESGSLYIKNTNEYIYSAYTVDDTFDLTYKVTINPVFIEHLSSVGVTINETEKIFGHGEGQKTPVAQNIFQGGTRFFYWNITIGGVSFCKLSAENANKAIDVALQHLDIPIYSITVNAVGTHSAFENTFNVFFAESSLNHIVTAMSLSESNIIL